MNLIDKINKKQINPNVPEFRVGDTVRVDVKIKEGKRERIQAFEGVVTARKGGSVSETFTVGNKERIQVFEGIIIKVQGGGVNQTFTVRKTSYGVGVEKTWPVHSPIIEKIEVVRRGKVRRAKLNFLKGIKGTFKIKERN